MEKEKCFAYDILKNDCKALTELYCQKKGKCPFFKTKEEYETALQKLTNRSK